MDEIDIELNDYVATVNSGKYANDEKTLMSKFPKLQGYDQGALNDYVATSNSGKYDSEVLKNKFPEFYGTPETKAVEPKGVNAEVIGDSKSALVKEPFSSDSKKIDSTKLSGDLPIVDSNKVLSSMEDGGLSYKERASKSLQDKYKAEGVTDFSITDKDITKEALDLVDKDKKSAELIDKINSEPKLKKKKSYLSNLWDSLAAGSTELGKALSSIPETLYDIAAIPQNLFSKITGVDLETSSSKFKEKFDITNPVLDYYVEENKKIKENINEFNKKYETTSIYENIKKGNYSDAFQLLGSGITQSAPISISMMVGGAATSIPKLATAGTVAFTGTNKLEMDEANPEMSEIEKTIKSLGLAGAETVFSAISSGSLGKVYKDIIKKEGVEAGSVVFKEGLVTMYTSALKKHGAKAAMLGEGIEEVATTMTQNMIKGVPVFDNIEDSFIQGVGGGALYGAPISIKNIKGKVKTAYDNRQIDKILESDTNTFNTVEDAFSGDSKGKLNIDKLKIINKEGSYERLEKELDKNVKKGVTTEVDAEEIKQEFLDTHLASTKMSGIKLSDEKTVEAVELIKRKDVLKAEIKNLDDAIATNKKNELINIDEKLITLVNGKIEPKTETVDKKTTDTTEIKPEKTTVQAEGKEVVDKVVDVVEDKVVDVTPEQKTVYENTAKAIRSAKIYKTPSEALSKLQSNPAGLLVAAWDGALETVATTVEITGNIDSSIRKGLVEIKKSDWYKNLTAENKKKAVDIIEKDLRDNLTPLSDAVVAKSKQTVKSTVRKTTGQVDQSKKFTITEAKLLKEKFKNLEKGSKLGAKGMKDIKGSFIKEINLALKSLVNSKTVSSREASRVLSAVNQLNEKNYDKVRPLVDKVISQIESKGLNRQIKSVKSATRKGSKSNRTPLNIRQLAKGATQVNEKHLSQDSKQDYLDALVDVNKALKAATNQSYKMANEEKLAETFNKLIEESDTNRLKALAESMGYDSEGLSTTEITAMLNSENVDEHISDLKEEKAVAARKSLEKQAEYALMALNDVDGNSLSVQEKGFLKELKNVNLEVISSTDIRDLIKVVDNIVENDNFSSAYNTVSKIKAANNSLKATELFSKEDMGVIRKSVITDLKSVALIFKKVFMSTKKAAKFNLLSGLNRLSMSFTKHKKNIKDLSKAYDDLFVGLKKKHKNISKPENTMLRGLVGQLIQGNTKEDFIVNKSRIEDHLVQLKKNVTHDLRLGAEKLEIQYDKLKDLKSQEEVIKYTQDLKDGNWDIIDFWLKHFESTKEALKYNTEVIHGKPFEEIEGNYLPIKMKGDVEQSVDVDNDPIFSVNGLPTSKASVTTISRNKSKKLPKGRILDLDFDSVMFNKASAVSLDIETSADYKDVFNFFNSSKMEDMFGRETLNVFTKKVKEMRKVQLGVSDMGVSEDEITKNVTKIERIWKTVGTSIALGGLTQYPKQYISVVSNIVPNLGKHGGLMFKAMFTDKSGMKILDMASISLRGDTQGGTVTASTRISEAEKKASKAMVGRIMQETGLQAEKIRNALFFSLRKGDVNVAKSSWISFYQKSLLENGVPASEIDMNTEHEKIDDPKRQEAISYAELKVEETQISSDESRGSEFYQSKSAYKAILRSMFLPFQSFNINSKMRMLNDLNILGSKRASAEQKQEAGLSLLGTTGEMVTFQTMKYYILAPLIGLGKDAVLDLFNLDSPEEDEEAKSKFKFKQWYSALVKDLNPLSIGAFAEDMSIEVLNFLQYMQDGDSDEDYIDYMSRKQEEGDGMMFYRYKDKEERGKGFGASLLNGGGLYSIPMTQFGEATGAFDLMTKGTKRDDYGNLNEYDFDDNQQAFLKVAFAIELLSVFGLGEADTRRIFRKVKRDMLKETDKVTIK